MLGAKVPRAITRHFWIILQITLAFSLASVPVYAESSVPINAEDLSKLLSGITEVGIMVDRLDPLSAGRSRARRSASGAGARATHACAQRSNSRSWSETNTGFTNPFSNSRREVPTPARQFAPKCVGRGGRSRRNGHEGKYLPSGSRRFARLGSASLGKPWLDAGLPLGSSVWLGAWQQYS
jgi:hypothetical protein